MKRFLLIVAASIAAAAHASRTLDALAEPSSWTGSPGKISVSKAHGCLDVSVSAVSRWSDPDVPFVSALTEEGAGGVSGVASDLSFSMEDAFDVEGVDDSLLPSDVAVTASGGKWLTPKADRVKFVKADSAYEVETEYGNPSGLALSAKAGEGTFRGRFKVFAVTETGKSKKYTATVTGVVLDGVGYGTATIKKNGAVPVTVRAE